MSLDFTYVNAVDTSIFIWLQAGFEMFTHTSLYSANTQMFSEYYCISGIVLFTERVTRNYAYSPFKELNRNSKVFHWISNWFGEAIHRHRVKRPRVKRTRVRRHRVKRLRVKRPIGSNDIVSNDKRSKKNILCII